MGAKIEGILGESSGINTKLINMIIGECGLPRPEATRLIAGMPPTEKERGLKDVNFLRVLVARVRESVGSFEVECGVRSCSPAIGSSFLARLPLC